MKIINTIFFATLIYCSAIANASQESMPKLDTKGFFKKTWEYVDVQGEHKKGPKISFGNLDHMLCVCLGPQEHNVKKYIDTNSTIKELNTGIAVDSNKDLYVAYSDPKDNFKVTAKKYDKATKKWSRLGNESLSIDGTYDTAIAIDSKNIPYVAYTDFDPYKGTYTPCVKKYENNGWKKVSNIGVHDATYTSVAIDSKDDVYVAYSDGSNGYRVSVKKFDGKKWVNVGKDGFSNEKAGFPEIAIDKNDTPYVVYQDGGKNGSATVERFNGKEWVVVGEEKFSKDLLRRVLISFDNKNRPYITYLDTKKNLEGDIKFMKYLVPEVAHVDVLSKVRDVADLNATDPNAKALRYSLRGDDSRFFKVDPISGVLEFIDAPSYLNPKDKNYDNVYEIVVDVSNGTQTQSTPLHVEVKSDKEIKKHSNFSEVLGRLN